ncbi:hypothetical protein BD410DRAFT_843850 [Rickenella mellea]|uniref:DUF6533 domain-containing protein n=1 Tax=Rickenella mellea TaxID=50990 RepID=A0A4Y7PNY6_9AGAM|nr:hypothetical protein BD410DRAFT_843850 [Rickenella mellea]
MTLKAADEVDDLPEDFNHARITHMAEAAIERLLTSTMVSLSATVVLAYDTILTIPDEVSYEMGVVLCVNQRHEKPDQLEYIWFSKWSVGKLLYIAGRYPVLAFFLLDEIYEVKYWGPNAYNISILISYTFMTIGIPYSDVPNGSEKLAEAILTKLGFASLMIYDGLMFILILIRTFHEGRKTRARILTILFRDGMIYYTVIFALSAVNLLKATSPDQFKGSLIGSLAPTLLAAQSIGASHIILNLRKYAYRSQMLTSVQLTSIRYSERRTILDEFMFSQATAPDDNELRSLSLDDAGSFPGGLHTKKSRPRSHPHSNRLAVIHTNNPAPTNTPFKLVTNPRTPPPKNDDTPCRDEAAFPVAPAPALPLVTVTVDVDNGVVGVGVNIGVVNDDKDDASDADGGLTDGADSGGGTVLNPPVGGGDAGDGEGGGEGEPGPGVKMEVTTVVNVVVMGWGGCVLVCLLSRFISHRVEEGETYPYPYPYPYRKAKMLVDPTPRVAGYGGNGNAQQAEGEKGRRETLCQHILPSGAASQSRWDPTSSWTRGTGKRLTCRCMELDERWDVHSGAASRLSSRRRTLKDAVDGAVDSVPLSGDLRENDSGNGDEDEKRLSPEQQFRLHQEAT